MRACVINQNGSSNNLPLSCDVICLQNTAYLCIIFSTRNVCIKMCLLL